MLSFTGIFLVFPDAGRAAVALFTTISPSPRGMQASESSGRSITPDQAAAAAAAPYPDVTVATVGFPVGTRGVYRIALREIADRSARGATSVFVDPRSAAIIRRLDRSTLTTGDAFLAYQRPLHEGSALGTAGRVILCAGGLLPALFVITGTLIWLRTRRREIGA